MKIKPEPASAVDINEAGEEVLHSSKTASRVGKAPKSSPRTPLKYDNSCFSIFKGPIEYAVESYDGPRPLTIFSMSSDDSPDLHEIPGQRFRKVFYRDEMDIIHPNASRRGHVKLTVFVASQDEECPNPRLYVEQRVYRGNREMTVIQELVFRTNIQKGVEYVFKGCGDEDLSTGKQDLHVRFHSLEQNTFDSYMSHARYYGFDRNVDLRIDKNILKDGLFYRFPSIPGNVQSSSGISFKGGELQSLLEAKRKQMGTGDDQVLKLLSMTFPGLGHATENGFHVGALHLRILYH
ncbi:hypothetical protein ASPWEDRAFT_43577 [Aspergillus wentii DTO 134E9]|uniref:Uncharacterized protein n=1 Tax=Aspergillus wentii DTO 134E9 TaxID=1073089 RepID=A0A1L9RF40_ASPWE|nr:uncharacterized protein ASPWEDRAFT_43577 [Aspergillus wentii DTO 134E9]KAI9926223.1 hypothetical protein MW887_004686 [Aspergillus wentii]OJJ33549.1 hypothetical protein ASPWEDRAFT_43577 [Aspergillus wentii DTO 134E9]